MLPAPYFGPSTMPWFVYIILASDAQLYTGITTDMARRWREHNTGKTGAKYFRGRQPQCLCLLETAADRSSASQREAALKKLKRSAKLQLIREVLAQSQEVRKAQAGQIPFIEPAQLELL